MTGDHVKLGRRMTLMGQTTMTSETETNPSLPVGFMVMQSKLDYDEFCQALIERVLEIPAFERLRCRVIDQKIFAPIAIDVTDHVIEVDFDKLTDMDSSTSTNICEKDRKLAAFINDLTMAPLDITKPLWQLYIMQNYTDGKSIVIFKTHHCIADGASLSILLSSICDPTPELKEMQAYMFQKKQKNPTVGIMGALEVFWGTMLLALYYIWGFITVQFKYTSSFLYPELKTQLKNPLVGVRRIGWTQTTTVADIKVIGKALGGTVNDVLMAAICGALRRYLLESGEWDQNELKPLRLACPVNVRTPDDYDADYILRNMFGFVLTTSPIDEPDRVKRLKIVHRSMKAIKRSPEQTLSYRGALLVARASATFQQSLMEFTNSYISYVCTNVAGPNIAMKICGVGVEYGLGVVPPPPTVGLGFAIWSYYGMLRVAVASDVATQIDQWKLCRFVDDEIKAFLQIANKKHSASATVNGVTKKAQ